NMPHNTAFSVCRKFSLRCEASRMSCVMVTYLTATPPSVAEPRKKVQAKMATTSASKTNPIIRLRRRCSGVITTCESDSLDLGRRFKGMERGRRWHCPFQALGAFPGFCGSDLALATVTTQDGVQEQQ